MVMTPIKAVNMGLCGYNGTTMAISLVAWILRALLPVTRNKRPQPDLALNQLGRRVVAVTFLFT